MNLIELENEFSKVIKSYGDKQVSQKVKSPLEYCLEILQESLDVIKLLRILEEGGDRDFLEKFTELWESKMKGANEI